MTIIEHEIPAQTEHPLYGLDETGQVLLQAADIIRKSGWAGPHKWGNPGTPRCIMGAIDEATPKLISYSDARKRLNDSLDKEPVTWNNEPGRTQEQVVEALERAAYGL